MVGHYRFRSGNIGEKPTGEEVPNRFSVDDIFAPDVANDFKEVQEIKERLVFDLLGGVGT